ncbi:unnamed protein product, partial [Amoebophrya sp. A120]
VKQDTKTIHEWNAQYGRYGAVSTWVISYVGGRDASWADRWFYIGRQQDGQWSHFTRVLPEP